MMKRFFSKPNLIRLALALGAVAAILLLLPRPDHQSYNYELNQPWKYPLLTAEFDIPIMRDSASARLMRDSIDTHFIPFVKNSPNTAKDNIARFSAMVKGKIPAGEENLLTFILTQIYARGVIDTKTYDIVHRQGHNKLRIAETANGASQVTSIDASEMLSPTKACEFVDSAFNASRGENKSQPLDKDVVKALNLSINPNIIVDTAADNKFRSQEYLNVTGALGVIKKGQRIVDRGEIVTPQIFTNLNTYQSMVLQNKEGNTEHSYFFIGQGIYIILCFGSLFIFMKVYRSRFFSNLRQMTFLICFITIFVAFSIAMFEYLANGLFLVPFAAVPVVLLVFFDSRTAIFSMLVTIFLSALVATYPFQFIFVELIAGLCAAFSIHQLSRRSQLLRTALVSFIGYVVAYFAISLLNDGDLSHFSWRMIGIFAINSVVLSFAYILILVIEKLFGFTSTVTLVELSDINNPLLRRLAEEAPGTFQHSMQVSMLASEAARSIGANTQLVRTGALYHDIGKMESPIFFTENQHGVNPHAGLDPVTSAHKIISHVTGGLTLASKEKLPQVIRDFISQHHGKGITKYFYNTAVNNSRDGNVDKSEFSYPGPNPQSKETAILMMADAVEAASRSLKNYSEQEIDALVDKIIDSQISDGLLKESPLSFKDVEMVKKTFKKRLATIYHSRVAYPELKAHS